MSVSFCSVPLKKKRRTTDSREKGEVELDRRQVGSNLVVQEMKQREVLVLPGLLAPTTLPKTDSFARHRKSGNKIGADTYHVTNKK